MRRVLLGVVLGALIGAGAVGAAPSGDQTVKGDLTVNGNTFVHQALVVTGATALSDTHADYLNSPRIAVTSGGFGYGWLNEQGTEETRIVAGHFADPASFPAPPSSLLINRDPAQLWFRTDAGWTCIAGC